MTKVTNGRGRQTAGAGPLVRRLEQERPVVVGVGRAGAPEQAWRTARRCTGRGRAARSAGPPRTAGSGPSAATARCSPSGYPDAGHGKGVAVRSDPLPPSP
jgi:hypothetical protein